MSSPTRVILDPKRFSEHVFPPFDFSARVPAGVTISSAAAVVSVWSGVDGSPTIVWDGTVSIVGSIVSPGLQNGLVGVIYLVKVTANVGTQVLVLEGLLAILPEGI